MTIGIVYDATIRNNGTAVLCWDALKRGLALGDQVSRYEPHGKLPEHDFYLYIDDGRDDLKGWECPKPNAYWAIDTHLGYPFRAEKAKQFDHVFCAQKDGAERMRADGLPATWLPLACHPPANPCYSELLAHPDRDRLGARGMDKCWDVVFVGYINEGAGPNSHNRLEYLDRLFKEVPNFWISTNVFFEDMAVRFVRSRVGFNISIRNDLNMRFFEVLSTGTCLVTNRDVIGLEDTGFLEGQDFVGYEGMDEMVEKVRWCLKNPLEREEIARSGFEKVRRSHTYAHRMQKVLEVCGVKIPSEQEKSDGLVGEPSQVSQ